MDFFHAMTKEDARKMGKQPGSKPVILVTGAGGQLGNEFRELSSAYSSYQFFFASKDVLPINDEKAVRDCFEDLAPDYCINCAAYTAVDRAEDASEKEKVFDINATALKILGSISKEFETKLFHFSTDYVFSGKSRLPYKENDHTDPMSVYGSYKEQGEKNVIATNPATIVIRSSWLYSSFGKNFVKTMLRLMKEKEEVSVVNDQVGSPTYAADLAEAVMTIISSKNWVQGIYHYANTGAISWYDFAVAIKEISGSDAKVISIPGSAYSTPAKRPNYSVFDTSKIRKTFGLKIPGWKESLTKCLEKINVKAEL